MRFEDWFADGMPVFRSRKSWPQLVSRFLEMFNGMQKAQKSGYLRFHNEPDVLTSLGYTVLRTIAHAPYPIAKSRFDHYLRDLAIQNSAYKFRHKNNYRVFVLYANIEAHYGAATCTSDWGYANFQKNQLQELASLQAIISNPAQRMVCIQSIDCADTDIQNQIEHLLQQRLQD